MCLFWAHQSISSLKAGTWSVSVLLVSSVLIMEPGTQDVLRNTCCLTEQRMGKGKMFSGHVDVSCIRPDRGGDLRLGLSRKVPSLSTPKCHLTWVFMLLIETFHVQLFFYLDGTFALFFVLLVTELNLYVLADYAQVSLNSSKYSWLFSPTSPRHSLLSLGLGSALLLSVVLLAHGSARPSPCCKPWEGNTESYSALVPGIIPEKCGHSTNYLVHINCWTVLLHIILMAQKVNI